MPRQVPTRARSGEEESDVFLGYSLRYTRGTSVNQSGFLYASFSLLTNTEVERFEVDFELNLCSM